MRLPNPLSHCQADVCRRRSPARRKRRPVGRLPLGPVKRARGMTRGKRAIVAIGIGFVVGVLCYDLLKATKSNGDFWLSLHVARNLLAGTDPYKASAAPDAVPYPVTAGLLAMPFSWLPDPLPSGIFMGLSSSLLAW